MPKITYIPAGSPSQKNLSWKLPLVQGRAQQVACLRTTVALPQLEAEKVPVRERALRAGPGFLKKLY